MSVHLLTILLIACFLFASGRNVRAYDMISGLTYIGEEEASGVEAGRWYYIHSYVVMPTLEFGRGPRTVDKLVQLIESEGTDDVLSISRRHVVAVHELEEDQRSES